MDDIHMVMRDSENKVGTSYQIIQMVEKMRYNYKLGITKGKVSIRDI